MQVVQLELDFSRCLELAKASPSIADWQKLCLAFDAAMEQTPASERLAIGADAIVEMAKVFLIRASKFLSFSIDEDGEIVFEEDFFDQFLAEPPPIDVKRYLKVPELYVRNPNKKHKDTESVAGVVDKQELLDSLEPEPEPESQLEPLPLLELEHDEDVAAWAAIVRDWMVANNCRCGSISELVDATNLPTVKVWIAALLSDFELEQTKDFYSFDGLVLSVESVAQREVA
jgi:hypothetical protein